MISGRMAVKHSNQGSEIPGNHEPGTPRWLRGWPLAIPSVGIAALAALLGVPRPTKPSTVPEPAIHVRDLNAELRDLDARARRAKAQPLPFTIREVGEAYRRLGRIQFHGAGPLDDAQATRWRSLIHAARTRLGDEPLLTLRAVQVELFVEALVAWERTGNVSDELVELGGDFIPLAQRHNWWKKGALRVSGEERWALGILRWTTLAGLLKTPPYPLSRDMEVLELRFFFGEACRDHSATDLARRIIERYAELEPDYPIEYASGVLAAERSQFEGAAAHFMRQLQAHPNGVYVTRARNHLIWATQQQHALERDVETR